MAPRNAGTKRSAVVKQKEAAETEEPLFHIEIDGKAYKVYTSLVTWRHEAILKSETQLFEPGGFTVRKLYAQVRSDNFTQMTLAGIIMLSRLQAGETITFIEIADEFGSGYEEGRVNYDPEPEEDDPGEAPGDDS